VLAGGAFARAFARGPMCKLEAAIDAAQRRSMATLRTPRCRARRAACSTRIRPAAALRTNRGSPSHAMRPSSRRARSCGWSSLERAADFATAIDAPARGLEADNLPNRSIAGSCALAATGAQAEATNAFRRCRALRSCSGSGRRRKPSACTGNRRRRAPARQIDPSKLSGPLSLPFRRWRRAQS
jgi:hypothetical protein